MRLNWRRFFEAERPGRLPARLDLGRLERYAKTVTGGEDAYLSLYEKAARLSGSKSNLYKQLRFHTLMQMVERVAAQGPAGDVAECGCWKGHSTYMIDERLQAAGWPGRMFVFDSFGGGLSDKVEADRGTLRGDTSAERTAAQKTSFASSREAVQRLLRPFPFVEVHEGWIPQVFATVPGLAERRFALVHVDVDLYEPTRDSLAFFATRMAPGGVVVVDDYGSALFPGCKVAVDAFRAEHPPTFFVEGHVMGAVLVF